MPKVKNLSMKPHCETTGNFLRERDIKNNRSGNNQQGQNLMVENLALSPGLNSKNRDKQRISNAILALFLLSTTPVTHGKNFSNKSNHNELALSNNSERFLENHNPQIQQYSDHFIDRCQSVNLTQISSKPNTCLTSAPFSKTQLKTGNKKSIKKPNTKKVSTVPVTQNTKTHQFSKNNENWITLDKIIHPRELEGKKRDVDYVLLVHRTDVDNLPKIWKKGLRSIANLALDPNSSEKIKKKYKSMISHYCFGNDPTLIYFRPVTRSSEYQFPISKDDIVIAVDPKNILVFNSLLRWNSICNKKETGKDAYFNDALSLFDYDKIQAARPENTVLNQYKNFVPKLGFTGKPFLAECLVKTDIINPEMFLSHTVIKKLN